MSRSMGARRRLSKPGRSRRIKLGWNRGIGIMGRLVFDAETYEIVQTPPDPVSGIIRNNVVYKKGQTAILVQNENGQLGYAPKALVDAQIEQMKREAQDAIIKARREALNTPPERDLSDG